MAAYPGKSPSVHGQECIVPPWKKLLNMPELLVKMLRMFFWTCTYLSIFSLKKYCVLCEILRFKVVGLVMSFDAKEEEECLLIHLRRTTSVCYRLGYCYVLVNRG